MDIIADNNDQKPDMAYPNETLSSEPLSQELHTCTGSTVPIDRYPNGEPQDRSTGTQPSETGERQLQPTSLSIRRSSPEILDPSMSTPTLIRSTDFQYSLHLNKMCEIFGRCTPLNLETAKIMRVMQGGDNLVRDDISMYLTNQLPYWQKSSLWSQSVLEIPGRASSTEEHFVMVSRYAINLNQRLSHDPLRLRMTQILLFHWHQIISNSIQADKQAGLIGCDGKVNSSHATDYLLAQIHVDDWHQIDEDKRQKRRATFHDHKRYGRRWLTLASHLGFGILICCGRETSALVYEYPFCQLVTHDRLTSFILVRIIPSTTACFRP